MTKRPSPHNAEPQDAAAGPRTRIFRIRRYKPGAIDPPRFMTYPVSSGPEGAETVLDGLEQIRLEQDPSLMYRRSCHHSACGTCACRIDGVPRLACTTKLSRLPDDPITVEPLRGFVCSADLVVQVDRFFRDLDPAWSCRKKETAPGAPPPPAGMAHWTRLEDCIECGCCVSSCPVFEDQKHFAGPAALAMLHAEMQNDPEAKRRLLEQAGRRRWEPSCRRALFCSRVCPTGVYPARRIAELRKKRRTPTGATDPEDG